MSKLISEADKLLEKGKVPEAIEKLKAALKAEPLNQLVATKLANVYVDSGDRVAAAGVYSSLAGRLSDAGKAQVAIAIYKQALDLDPENINLKLKLAQECEGVGKVGDAQNFAGSALQFYLRRKRFFDATNVFPLLIRCQPKDEKLKLGWLEVLQLSQAEQKLAHFLVAVCGPPGLASQEFTVGGEPTAMSEGLYEALKNLVSYFPRDPKVAYAVAWAAHRRGRNRDFYHYLRESLRREPDFCLSLLLYARVLAEQQKLNESLFIYKHLKERMPSDKSLDMLTLNRLVEAFVEKNGWITFTEGMGVEELSADGFKASIQGKASVSPKSDAASSIPAPPVPSPPPLPGSSAQPPALEAKEEEPSHQDAAEVPAEIELSGGDGEEGELLLTSNAAPRAGKPVSLSQPQVHQKPPVQAQPEVQEESPLRETTGTVEFTSIIKVEGGESATEQAEADSFPAQGPEEIEPEENQQRRPTFNPLENLAVEKPTPTAQLQTADKTQMFSPLDLLGAARIVPSDLGSVETKTHMVAPEPPPSTSESPPRAQAVYVEGQPTQLFTPMEAVQAGVESRNQQLAASAVESAIKEGEAKQAEQNKQEAAGDSLDEASRILAEGEIPAEEDPLAALAQAPGESTVFLSRSEQEPVNKEESVQAELQHPTDPDPLAALAQAPEESTMMVPMGGGSGLPPLPAAIEADSGNDQGGMPAFSLSENLVSDNLSEPASPPASQPEEMPALKAPAVVFVKIPELNVPEESIPPPVQAGPGPDLGEDLLEGPTKMLVFDQEPDDTAHLIKEIEKDFKLEAPDAKKGVEAEEAPGPGPDYMLKKAERYIAKRNYYLARKALRHSLALGADESHIKAKLSEIRKLEFPDGLYNTISSDGGPKEASSEILERLELEFDLRDDAELDGGSIVDSVESQLDSIFSESDPKTILDFGVALYEMGLFKQAETVFSRTVDDFPETAFDAYYLAAISKSARKDYAGAASILKKLSADSARPEIDKIQVYYALGEIFEKMRRPERSLEFFRKVADLDANYRNVRHKLDKQ